LVRADISKTQAADPVEDRRDRKAPHTIPPAPQSLVETGPGSAPVRRVSLLEQEEKTPHSGPYNKPMEFASYSQMPVFRESDVNKPEG
jgi:hypothetical protein